MDMNGKCKWVTDKDHIESYSKKLSQSKQKQDDRYKNLLEVAENDFCEVNRENIQEETMANIGKYQRWIDRLYQEKKVFNTIKQKKNQMEGELYHYYKFNCDFNIKTEAAISKYISANKCYIALSELMDNQKSLIEFVEGLVQNLHNRNFAIKNVITLWCSELGIT
jgi:hypothetical protein